MSFFKRKKDEEPAVSVSSSKKKTTKPDDKKTKDSILLKVLVTEKIARLGDKGVYAFGVSNFATKISVAKAIKARYGVLPRSVRMMNVRGKYVRYGRSEGRRADWKKAMVFLKEGDRIDVHEGV
mgnify:FL=1